MDYEKKYKDALHLAKSYYGKDSNEFLDTIFPELRESEDEIHRKWILEYLYDGLRKSDEQFKEQFKAAIAYLEKQEEQKPEHFELKAGKWYICHRAFCCRADHLTVKEGERFMCEKDGVVKGFVIKEPEKYFKECSDPAPMEDEQKGQKPAEWSEEDEKRIQRIYDFLWKNRKGDTDTIYQIEKDAEWLKSPRPDSYKNCNSRWKPSKEQPEVGLEKEIEVASKRFPEVSFAKLSRIAKRFYELGLRAGQVYAATTYNPPCYCGGPCTNPMHDCINCPRQLTGRINTTTGTSSAKLEESK